MESDENNLDTGINSAGSAPAPGNARWNPTKEQIDMLESLYNQGIRTPSADQIQQITGRLKAYGHIEGKNVFYWFQNHKARQRQKQKQESLAFLNHHHHHHHHFLRHRLAFPPPPPSPSPNVVCGPYYLSPTELGFYPSCPKVVFPASEFKPRPPRSSEKTNGFQSGVPVPSFDLPATTTSSNHQKKLDHDQEDIQETLPLFPLHPTGILRGDDQATTSSLVSSSSGEGCGDKSFYDFFSGQSSLTCHATSHHYS